MKRLLKIVFGNMKSLLKIFS